MQIYGSNILTLDFDNNFAMVNGEDYCVDKDLTPNRTSVFGQYGGPLSFSRGSQAMVTDKTGRLTYAPNNLLTYSEQFDNAAWTKANTTIAPNAIVAPDGSVTADKWVENTANAQHYIAFAPSYVAGVTYITSICAKAAEKSTIYIHHGTGAFGAGKAGAATFNLTNGTITSVSGDGATANITNLGNGWYRCSLCQTATSTVTNSSYFSISGLGTYTGTDGVGIYIWGAQLEAVTYQTTPRAYIPTTTAAYYGPRFDYDPVTLVPKGMLIEEARTNNFTYSQLLNNAYWTRVGMTITEDQVTAPDGTLTADKCEVTSNEREFSGPNQIAIFPIGSTAAWSVYTKKGNVSTWPFRVSTIGTAINAYGATFNFDTGTFSGVTSGLTASAVSVGSGWYRLTFVFTVPAAATSVKIQWRTYVNSTSGVGDFAYFWGAQAEAGSFATSYIPTVASTVIRNADTCTISGSLFNQWFNGTQGTFVVGADSLYNVSSLTTSRYLLADTTKNGFILYTNVNDANIRSYDGTNNLPAAVSNFTSVNKLASAYGTDKAVCVNGGAVSTGAYSGTWSSLVGVGIGCATLTGSLYLNGHIRSIQYYPTRLPNSQLQALTV